MENLPGREHLVHAHQLTEETAQKLLHFVESSPPVKRLRASQLASALVGAVGFALFVGGIERAAEESSVLREPYVEMGVGLLLLVATGLLLQKLRGGD